MFFSPLKQHKKTTGVTLIELMIAIVISSILVLGIAEIFKLNKRSSKISDDSARMQESGRFAFNMIMQDLRRAGYYGGNADTANITGTSNIVASTNTCPTNTTWGRMLERRIIGLNDTGAAYACLSADHLRGDVLVLRYTEGKNITAFDANRFYVRSSLFEGRMFTGNVAANASNSVSEIPNNVQLLASQAYYIGTAQDGGADRSCHFDNSKKIPALFREVLSSTGVPVQEEVASGIEHLQVQYGVDRSVSQDGEVNTYYNANAISNDTTLTPNWSQVVSVRFWVLARSECPTSGYNNTKTYTMGDMPYTPSDSFKRQLYSTTVTLRNGS